VSNTHPSDSSPSPHPDDASRGAGTRLRRPPGIWVLLLVGLVLGAVILFVVLRAVGDETDMEEQPEQRSAVAVTAALGD
jgi:hypothetical protein